MRAGISENKVKIYFSHFGFRIKNYMPKVPFENLL